MREKIFARDTLFWCVIVCFFMGFVLLQTGENNAQDNPFFKLGINLWLIGSVLVLVDVLLRTGSYHIRSYIRENIAFFVMFFVIVFMICVSFYFTADISLSWKNTRRYIIEPMLFLLCMSFFVYQTTYIKAIIYIIFFVMCLHPIVTILDFLIHIIIAQGDNYISIISSYRPKPFFFYEPQTGHAFFLITSLSFSLAFYKQSQYKNTYLLLVAINILAILISNTRLSYIPLAIVLIVFLFFTCIRYRAVVIIGSIVAIAVSSVILYHISVNFSDRYNLHKMIDNIAKVWSLSPAAMGRFDKLCNSNNCMPQSFPKDTDIMLEHSSLNRISMTKSTWLGIMDNPLRPNGFGVVLFAKNIVKIFGSNADEIPYFIHKDDDVVLPFYWTNHNGILYIWFELGFIGFVAIFLLHLWVIYTSYKLMKISQLPYIRAFLFAIILTIIGLVFANLFDTLPNRAGSVIMFIIFGILLSINAKKELLYDKS